MNVHTLSATTTAVVLAALFSLTPATAHALSGSAPLVSTDAEAITHETVQYQQIDLSRIRVTSSSHHFTITQGVMRVTDVRTGQHEELPSTATDAAGNQVTLYYERIGDGEVVVTAVLPNSQTDEILNNTRAVLHPDIRCWLGIVGSGIGGALGGAAAGSVVPGVGTVAGGIAGAISGNAVGTATFC